MSFTPNQKIARRSPLEDLRAIKDHLDSLVILANYGPTRPRDLATLAARLEWNLDRLEAPDE